MNTLHMYTLMPLMNYFTDNSKGKSISAGGQGTGNNNARKGQHGKPNYCAHHFTD